MGWKLIQQDSNIIEEYKEKVRVNDLMAKVLHNRGLSADDASNILYNPQALLIDPYLLVNVEQAAREIIAGIETGAEIWVFADYDMDGFTSGYTMSDFLKSVTDNDVYPYYPNRSEGYGLNMDFCKTLVERREEIGKPIFVITVDNGTACIEQVKFLKDNGIEVVVTDHHQPKGTLPDCTIVNPHIVEDDTYHHLCGCSVAYKVIQVIADMAGIETSYVEKYLYAVSFGTIADMMPLTKENMAFTRLGLEQVNSDDCPASIKLLKEFLGKKKITPNDIGWEIAPRLNSCGRMGDSDKGGMLFAMNEGFERAEIYDLILDIDELNEDRKALLKKAQKDLENEDYSDDFVCLFDASSYPVGIAGIIAARILEKENKPALVYSGKDVLTGSSRAPEWINLQVLLEAELQKGNLLGYGGHEQAAGFSFAADKYFDLKDSLNETIKDMFAQLPTSTHEETDIVIDAEIRLSDITKSTFEMIHSFPYNRTTFSAPSLMSSGLSVVSFKYSMNNPNNVCLTLNDGSKKNTVVWAWGFGELYKAMGEPSTIDILGTVDENFMIKGTYTLRVKDLRAA